MQNLKIEAPVEDFKWPEVTQFFGMNKSIYAKFGIPGHNGIDMIKVGSPNLSYGQKILAAHDFDTVEIVTDFPTKKRGTGIYLKKRLAHPERIKGIDAYFMETVYWHLADVLVDHKSSGEAGDVIGLMGNTGYVLPKPSNNCKQCPYFGTHLHFGIRFYDVNGVLIPSDYKGYVDPVPFMRQDDELHFIFKRDLFIGSSGDDVSNLQTILAINGYASDYDPIGYFGKKTLRDLRLFQLDKGISPAFGYFGVKTRKFLQDN